MSSQAYFGVIKRATNTGTIGATPLASDADCVTGTANNSSVTPTGLAATLGTRTLNGVIYGRGPGVSLGATAAGTTGQLLVATTASNPNFASSANADFSFTNSTAATTRTLTVSQSDNTSGSSNATMQITTGGSSSGDPKTTYTITGATSFSTGLDNSDSDKYKISASTALGTTDTFIMTTGGNRTLPLNSCFQAYRTAGLSNVTGDGTTYQVVFETVNFDQNSNYNNTTGEFTAPVAGKYLLSTSVVVNNLSIGHTYLTGQFLYTGAVNGSQFAGLNPYAISYSNIVAVSGSIVATLPAGASVVVAIQVGTSTKTVGLQAGAVSYFSACLLS